VGERVVDRILNGKAGRIIEISDRIYVRLDTDAKYQSHARERRHLRPETCADREKRAKEIVANAKPGDRFRVIERPVNSSGTLDEGEERNAGKALFYSDRSNIDGCGRFVREIGDSNFTTHYWWNLVPLPREAEEPRTCVCPNCAGSGNGAYEELTCDVCGGGGEVPEEPKEKRWELVSRRHITQDDMGRKYYQFVNNAFRPISEKDVGCYATIVRPLTTDLQIGRLQRTVDNQRRALRQLHTAHDTLRRQLDAETSKEVEAMREFCRLFDEWVQAEMADKWNNMHDAYGRVLDARGEK
jgi:hypothetical protein